MDEDGYPTDEELETIRKYKFQTWEDVLDLLEHIRELWWHNSDGFVLKGKNILKLQLHTWGWSGNESVIGALEQNTMFYPLFWVESRLGGHYKFEFRKSMFRSRSESN